MGEKLPRLRFQKAYLEITNVCNLHCSFCPDTCRKKGFLSPEQFALLGEKLRPYTDHLYLHLMGEPLLHPQLERILQLGAQLGFRLMITTNGTLLEEKGALLLDCPAVQKVSISVHSFEGNGRESAQLTQYLHQCTTFATRAAQAGKRCALRLWNLDGAETVGDNSLNAPILAQLEQAFPKPWLVGRRGTTLISGVYLEWGEKFQWPELDGGAEPTRQLFCRGLRDQVGVLWDGRVVPCCLDHNGDIPLGNLYDQSMEAILTSPRAQAIYDGFSQRRAVEPLCQTCGYAKRF